jgi:hypothetical protein
MPPIHPRRAGDGSTPLRPDRRGACYVEVVRLFARNPRRLMVAAEPWDRQVPEGPKTASHRIRGSAPSGSRPAPRSVARCTRPSYVRASAGGAPPTRSRGRHSQAMSFRTPWATGRSRPTAITIDAPPEDVWRWLVQMGSGRAGSTPTNGSNAFCSSPTATATLDADTSRVARAPCRRPHPVLAASTPCRSCGESAARAVGRRTARPRAAIGAE